jgi:hypothetical protein
MTFHHPKNRPETLNKYKNKQNMSATKTVTFAPTAKIFEYHLTEDERLDKQAAFLSVEYYKDYNKAQVLYKQRVKKRRAKLRREASEQCGYLNLDTNY